MTDLAAPIAHVESILGAVPHETYGHINLVTFNHDSPEINKLKHEIAEGIVQSLDAQGHIADREAPKIDNSHPVKVICQSCSTPLFAGVTDHDGGIAVGGPALLQHLQALRLECPHTPFTAEDLRRHIQDSVQ